MGLRAKRNQRFCPGANACCLNQLPVNQQNTSSLSPDGECAVSPGFPPAITHTVPEALVPWDEPRYPLSTPAAPSALSGEKRG